MLRSKKSTLVLTTIWIGMIPSIALAQEEAQERAVWMSDGRFASSNMLKSPAERREIAAWRRSLIPLVSSQTLDITSSWGGRELNPLLSDTNGRFGVRGILIKGGTTAAIVGVEYWIVRKWPRAARVLSRFNWGSSALAGGLAARNYWVR
jgi:hypothetical protein